MLIKWENINTKLSFGFSTLQGTLYGPVNQDFSSYFQLLQSLFDDVQLFL